MEELQVAGKDEEGALHLVAGAVRLLARFEVANAGLAAAVAVGEAGKLSGQDPQLVGRHRPCTGCQPLAGIGGPGEQFSQRLGVENADHSGHEGDDRGIAKATATE